MTVSKGDKASSGADGACPRYAWLARILSAPLLVVWLIGPFGIEAAGAGTLTVRDDTGGSILARAVEVQGAIRSGEHIRITGNCWSACTMYLAVPGTCVTRGARLGFHGPFGASGELESGSFELMSGLMADHYPQPIRDLFLTQWRHSRRLTMLSGSELIRIAGVPECA